MQQDINKIIQSNTGLVFNQLKHLKVLFDPDAESIGYEALYNAVLTYDDSKGIKFSTYATCCIYNALGSYIRTKKKKRQIEEVSYNNIAFNDDGVEHEFLELFCSNDSVDSGIIKAEVVSKVCEVYQYVYNRLTNEKHKAIISAWHTSDYTLSNNELAEYAGVSQPYVNQIINTFKYNMRKRLEEFYYG